MVKVDQIVELILDVARERRVLNTGVYKDEPIIRTGRDAFGSHPSSRAKRIPESISRMRALSRGRTRWSGSYPDVRTFYEQAKFMEYYADDYPYLGNFEKYYPTYDDMSTEQLRGYFTWRTRWRAGETPQAPLSFLFVHVYELLCGVGAPSALAAFAELERMRNAYASIPGFGALGTYLAVWMGDFTIYHGLDRELLGRDAQGAPVERAISVIDGAERALLASKTPGTWSASTPGLPDAEDFTFALTAASRYRLERSKLFSDRFDVLAECCCAVFARMVDHCHRRRKKCFSEGLFGGEETIAYTIYRSAVFYDPNPHPDATVRLESGVEYTCRNGRWARTSPHRKAEPSAELGDILHETDRVLRERLGGFPELKVREVPKYVQAIVDEEVTACLARRAAEEAARVVIDRSALTGIRAAAVRTREALLVDEEREEAPALASVPAAVPAQEPVMPAKPQVAAPVAGLSADDAALLSSLLDGTFNPSALPAGTMVTLAVDRINEALFDVIGDTAIEFEGDTPRIVEDYADDIREVLG